MTTATEQQAKQQLGQQSRYISLSPTTLYRVPDCYGGRGKPDMLSDACTHCFLKKQCRERQEVIWK